MPNPYVVAVVVTFNRVELLELVLEAVSQQTRTVDHLLVIDNASTDGTAEVVEQWEHSGKLSYLRQSHNLGGAGGFATGITEAVARGADWVWIMDDDAMPLPDCLEKLLQASPQSEFVTPLRIATDGTEVSMEWMVDPLTFTRSVLPNLSFRNGNDITFVRTGCFEGALISQRIIDILGVPDPSYFIAHDDTLYAMKASIHTNVCVVAGACMQRLLPTAAAGPWKAYFVLRNMYYLTRDITTFYEVQLTMSQRVVASFHRMVRASNLLRRGFPFIVPVLRGVRDGRRYLRSGQKPSRVRYP